MHINFSCTCRNSFTIEKSNDQNSIYCPKCKKLFVCPEIATPKLSIKLVDGAMSTYYMLLLIFSVAAGFFLLFFLSKYSTNYLFDHHILKSSSINPEKLSIIVFFISLGILAGYRWTLLMPFFFIVLFLKSGFWRWFLFYIPLLLIAHFWGEAFPRWIYFVLGLLSIIAANLYMYWYYMKDPSRLTRQKVIPTNDKPLKLDESSYEVITGTLKTGNYTALLLRSFKDDSIIIGNEGSGELETHYSLEESLSTGLASININCVKLGLASQPDARGVTVIATTKDKWYNQALLLIKYSSIILVIVNDTQSLLREIKYILENDFIQKTYFIFKERDLEEKWSLIEPLLINKVGRVNIFPKQKNWNPVLLNISKAETKIWCVRITKFTSRADHTSIINSLKSIKDINNTAAGSVKA